MKRTTLILLFSFSLLAMSSNVLSMKLMRKVKKTSIPSGKHFHTTFQVCNNAIPKNTITVSVECAKNIDNINNDGGKLYYFFKGVFKGAGEQNRLDVKPSHMLKWLINTQSFDIDQATNLTYTDASVYLKSLSNHFDRMDAVFEKKYNETKNIQQTWQWFDGYFKEEILVKLSTEYKYKLIEHDKQMREYAKKGIFFSPDGRTVIINPFCATDKE